MQLVQSFRDAFARAFVTNCPLLSTGLLFKEKISFSSATQGRTDQLLGARKFAPISPEEWRRSKSDYALWSERNGEIPLQYSFVNSKRMPWALVLPKDLPLTLLLSSLVRFSRKLNDVCRETLVMKWTNSLVVLVHLKCLIHMIKKYFKIIFFLYAFWLILKHLQFNDSVL